jgi:hypothetical protein
MYEDQEEFWDDFSWLAGDEAAAQALTAALGGGAWRTDGGATLYARYQAMDATTQGLVDDAVDMNSPDEKVAALTRLFAGSGAVAATAAPTGAAVGPGGVHADAEALSGVAGWEAYGGWYRRYDGSAWVYARSDKVGDTWVSQEDMVAEGAKTPQPPGEQPKQESDVHADAEALSGVAGWEAYGGWYRRYDGSAWKFAPSARKNDTWVDQQAMVDQMAARAAQQPATPVPGPVLDTQVNLAELELPPLPAADDVPDAVFDETAELTDAQIDQIIETFPQIQLVVDQLLEQAAATVAANPGATAVVADLEDEELDELVEMVAVGTAE